MQKEREETLYLQKLTKILANDFPINESNKLVNEKIVEVEEYILNINFKELSFNDIVTYYNLLNSILSKKNTLNMGRELNKMQEDFIMKGEIKNE